MAVESLMIGVGIGREGIEEEEDWERGRPAASVPRSKTIVEIFISSIYPRIDGRESGKGKKGEGKKEHKGNKGVVVEEGERAAGSVESDERFAD